MAVTLLDQLTSLRTLLIPETAWTKGAAALDEDGVVALSIDDEAVCFCLYGAARRIAILEPIPEEVDVVTFVIENLKVDGYENFATFNDAEETTHQDVLAFIDRLTTQQMRLGAA